MSYIGNTNTTQGFIPAIDYFSGNGSTVAFTLSRPVASVAQVQANISNVPQNPSSAFSVSGNTITFTSAPPSGSNNIYVYYTSPITQVIAPSQGTVSTTSLAGGTVSTTADITANGLTIGRGAGAVSTNTAVGASALAANTTGSYETAIGYQSGYSNTTGTQNFFGGSFAGYNNTTGSYNTALGYNAYAVSGTAATGSYNTGIGNGALNQNTTASNNTAVGYQSAYSNTTGARIAAFGSDALFSNTTGADNTAVGYYAMLLNTTGASNTAIGQNALRSNTTASNNTAVGYQAGYSNTTGNNSVNIGRLAGYSATINNQNTFVGVQAGYTSNVTAGGNGYNTFMGYAAGFSATTGYNNTFIGSKGSTGTGAGHYVTTGNANTILGGYDGNQGGLDIRTASNYIVLSDGDGNPRMWIANTNGYFVPNIRSSATANNDLRFNTGNGELYYQTSSQRYKTNIVDLEFDTSNLYNLRPVSYDDKATGEKCFGLIAEETFAQIPDVVVQREIDGERIPDSIPYSMLSVVIINEMKKLKTLVDTQAALITTLTDRITALEGAK